MHHARHIGGPILIGLGVGIGNPAGNRPIPQAMILHVHRNFLKSKIGAAEAEKAQVLGLDELERPQGTLGSFVKWTLLRTATGVAREQDTDARTIGPAGPPRHTSGRAVKTPAADRHGPQRCAEGRVRAQY
jgi:hypothetical protein